MQTDSAVHNRTPLRGGKTRNRPGTPSRVSAVLLGYGDLRHERAGHRGPEAFALSLAVARASSLLTSLRRKLNLRVGPCQGPREWPRPTAPSSTLFPRAALPPWSFYQNRETSAPTPHLAGCRVSVYPRTHHRAFSFGEGGRQCGNLTSATSVPVSALHRAWPTECPVNGPAGILQLPARRTKPPARRSADGVALLELCHGPRR